MSKKFFFAGFLVVIFSLVLFTTTWAAYGLEETARTAGLNTGLKLPTLIGNVIGTALSLIGVIFFALMIFGGFLWMTAHGKEEQAKQGMDTVIAAVIGLIIILAAYAITNFVFSSVGGTATTPNRGNTNVCCKVVSGDSTESKYITSNECSTSCGGEACDFKNVSSKDSCYLDIFDEDQQECSNNSDCLDGEICFEGICGRLLPVCSDRPYICDETCDCPDDTFCSDGKCVTPEPQCKVNTDCSNGEVCVLGSCQNPPPAL